MKKDKCKYYCYKKTRKKTNNFTKKMDKLELVVFDMDGVLVNIYSSWKYVHDYFNTSNEKSVNAYLKGEIDDLEFIKRDANLWKENGKPIKKEKLAKILADVPLMGGAKECIDFLKNKEIKTAIVSAGLDILAERVGKELGIDNIYSNGIKVDNEGYLTNEGILNVKLVHKDEAITRLAKSLKIPLDRIAAVGNSCFDITMFEACGLGIAFNHDDECTKKYADYFVVEKDLTKIIPFLSKYIN
jgi:phosphoserine phosphatase